MNKVIGQPKEACLVIHGYTLGSGSSHPSRRLIVALDGRLRRLPLLVVLRYKRNTIELKHAAASCGANERSDGVDCESLSRT